MSATVAAIGLGGRLLAKIAPPVLESIAAKVKKPFAEVRVQFTKTFEDHLDSAVKRAKHVKTVVSKDKPVQLSKIYVPLVLSNEEDKNVSDNSIDPTKDQGLRFIVSGTGGCGEDIPDEASSK